MDIPIDWLLEGEGWIQYRARRDLLGQAEAEPRVAAARAAMLADARVVALLAGLEDWPGEVIASHKSAGQPFHRLTFLADLGLRIGDPGVEPILARILASRTPEGPFGLPMNIAEGHGGSGEAVMAWALCDAPLVVYALVKFGLEKEPAVHRAIDSLTGLVRQNGWPCAVSSTLGGWRGPGRREDPCPFATLAMLKLLAEVDSLRDGHEARAGTETLMDLWQNSRTRHPYIFYMGTDFRKLKYPFIWYDLLYVLEVLSRFEWVRGDARFADMLAVLRAKADAQGRFTPESVWTAWKAWEFGQKKAPSRGLTLAAWRVMGRVGIHRQDAKHAKQER